MNREHLIQVAFSIDEDRIVQSMESQLRKKMSDNVEEQVKKALFGDRWSNYNGVCETVMKEWLNDNKEDVVNRAAEVLVERLYRTKAVKEMIKEVKENGSV